MCLHSIPWATRSIINLPVYVVGMELGLTYAMEVEISIKLRQPGLIIRSPVSAERIRIQNPLLERGQRSAIRRSERRIEPRISIVSVSSRVETAFRRVRTHDNGHTGYISRFKALPWVRHALPAFRGMD